MFRHAGGDLGHFVFRIGAQEVIASGVLNGDQLDATVDGHRYPLTVAPLADGYCLFEAGRAIGFRLTPPDMGEDQDHAGETALNAPMNGSIVALLVEPGHPVLKGDALLVMEAMKMEHTIRAPADGKVDEFYFAAGDLVDGGAELLAFDAAAD